MSATNRRRLSTTRLREYMNKPCLKVYASGVCKSPVNDLFLMHTCDLIRGHEGDSHKCHCGKEWDSPALTDSQYAVAAFIKAVE